MRTNGLLAEETERWAQNCLVACNPVYNPPLIEAGSALVSAINEMLLQSYNTVIEVFPALPACTFEIDTENMKYDQALKSSQIKVLWENCTFKGLLAEGGFEVSAKQKGNATEFVKIKSLAGKPVNLINPFKNSIIVECGSKIIDFEISGNLIKFHTSIGNEYIISEKGISYVNRNSKVDNIETETESNKPKIYKAPSNRRVYLGKDKDTDFIRKIDGITFDYYAGNQQISKVAVYRLDFTSLDLKKNYADILPPQFHGCGKMGLDFKKITKDMRFTHYAGIGWDSCDGLRYIDRNSPDSLRRDSIASNKKRSFILELAKGKYEVFFVTGDIDIPSYTAIRIEQGIEYIPARNNLPGEFTAEVIPIVHKKDGNLEIEFDTITGCSWNLNVIIINKFFYM